MSIRKAQVAGQFYPSSAKELKRQIESFLEEPGQRIEALGCVLPHAGYIYSGKVASCVLNHIKIRDNVVLLGPNHTGYGSSFSIMASGSWQTPLGDVKINEKLAQDILQRSQYLKDDPLAHAYEHSLEVELPFLQYLKGQFKFVPIAFLSDDIGALKTVGRQIAQSVKDCGLDNSVLLAASSDFTHYEPQALAEKKDKKAIEAILELDEDKLMKNVRSLRITMCGYAPIIVMLSAAKELGAKNAVLLDYRTSAQATGDESSVVGYAGIAVS